MAKRTLLDLANDLRKVVTERREKASDLAVSVATTIVTDLAFVTPVDESTAISNWVIGIKSPNRKEIDAHYLGSHGSTYSASARATVDAAKTVLASKRPGETIYISNNLKYIAYLNGGSSRQAPAGFVERAELLGRKIAEQGR